MFIEDEIEDRRVMWGEYHPRNKNKSCVMVRSVGCVFIGTVDQCQQYIADNEHRYAGRPRRVE